MAVTLWRTFSLQQKKPFCGVGEGGGGFMQPFKLTHNSRRAVIRQTGNVVWPGNRGSNSTSSVLNLSFVMRYAA